MTEFISSSFQKSTSLNYNTVQKEQFQAQLKDLINKAISENKILRNDWSKQTLPIFAGKPFERPTLACDSLRPTRSGVTLSLKSTDTHKRAKNVFAEENNVPEYSAKTPNSTKTSRIPALIPSIGSTGSSTGSSASSSTNSSKRPALEARIAPMEKVKKKKSDVMLSEDRKKLRAQRFERELSTPPPQFGPSDDTVEKDEIDQARPIIGTNQTLEKKYLRLTSQPLPENVRPIGVLEKTLKMLTNKYLSGSGTYPYLCDQLKSIRQDLTVQHIRTLFTIEIYEFHAKLAIEFKDLGEFNQCESQLKQLYETADTSVEEHFSQPEYMSYLILYHVITSNYQEVFMLKLKYQHMKNNFFFDLTYKIVDYCLADNYFELFKLYAMLKNTVNTSSSGLNPPPIHASKSWLKLKKHPLWFYLQLLEMIVSKERIKTLATICKAYRMISLEFLSAQLGFDSQKDLEEYLEKLQIKEFQTNETLECFKCKHVVETAKGRLYNRVDIKGQI
ncbi:unnamed protein product [Kuraishia capsulata CBS 1993]|uniref:SAC3/GANP/THP3 conserved domain-containing protein n=1 Tax=Kuraishia capsulata CBS 1993 TaxID=1382522 RepID=W6MFS7_9ASCO|nr:uncharacterized protein KUCA_T00000449001 [Kuraishia capsulata CBS 1993]CDK24486.1 unnamed protein product [Kuraishia capsulata CBS 1993]